MSGIRDSIEQTYQRAVKGVKTTVGASRIPVGLTPREMIWTLNKTRLYRYRSPQPVERRYPVPLLLVYALINKPYIFDLRPGRSFVEFMLGQGFDVYLLDWGVPGVEDCATRFDDYAAEYLPRAIRRMLGASGAEEYSLLGYCIGGVLAMLHAAVSPQDPIRSLTLLAPPLDFSSSEESLFSSWLDERYFDVDKLVDQAGNIPPGLIEFGSKMLKPVENYVGVYTSMWDRLDEDAAVESWQAMHRWVHDGVPFAGEASRQWAKDSIRGNKLMAGGLVVRGQRVDLASVRAPLLNVVAAQDHIVPRSQSLSVMERISSQDKRVEVIPGGHVGLMGGSGARYKVWPTIAEWVGQRSA